MSVPQGAEDVTKGVAIIVAAFAAFLSAAVAVYALRVNAAITLQNKRLDAVFHCNQRYDELYKFKISLLKIKGLSRLSSKAALAHKDVEAYFRRYWGLKSDQIDYWLAGYVDPETMTSWFLSTVDAMDGKNGIHAASYVEGWKNVVESHSVINESLIRIVDEIIENISNDTNRVSQYAKLHCLLQDIERSQSSLVKLLSRRSFRRSTFDALERTLPIHVVDQILAERDSRVED